MFLFLCRNTKLIKGPIYRDYMDSKLVARIAGVAWLATRKASMRSLSAKGKSLGSKKHLRLLNFALLCWLAKGKTFTVWKRNPSKQKGLRV